MMAHYAALSLTAAAMAPNSAAPAPAVLMPTTDEMTAMLNRSDPVWEFTASDRRSFPTLWTEAPFVGNGMSGMYATLSSEGLQIEVSRADYWDVRLPGSKYYSNKMYLDTPRLPGGVLTLDWPSTTVLKSGSARIHLFNGTFSVTLTLQPAAGSPAVNSSLIGFAAADRPELLVLQGSLLSVANVSWANRPASSGRDPDPHPNPVAVCYTDSEAQVELCEQPLLAGGGFAVARSFTCNKAIPAKCELLMALTNSVPGGIPLNTTATALAIAAITAAREAGVAAIRAAHAAWWLTQFWTRSVLSVPDPIFESFHTIQLYKVGSATRCSSAANCWAMDLAMPWYVPRGKWHDYHWDLNVQMSYWLVLPSNHATLGNSLVQLIKRALPYLIDSVAPAYRNDSAALAANTGFIAKSTCDSYLVSNISGGCFQQTPVNTTKAVQLGNLMWVAHNLWWQYRYTLDDEVLDLTVEVLKRAAAYYHRLARVGTDGKLHLPLAQSPEYADATDTSYDLALFRWGCGILVRIAATSRPELGADPAYPMWQHVCNGGLANFATGPSGLLIGNGVALTSGHRHWSHLFSLFPTTLLNPGPGPNHSELAIRSLDHYAAENGAMNFHPRIANGFPRVAISVMSAMAGRNAEAYGNISNWFLAMTIANNGYGGGSWSQNLGPNTHYQEAGGAPCNESPLGAAFAIQSWLLSSWNFGPPEHAVDTIRVFAAVPPTWPNASIGAMLAEGGYTVSSHYQANQTMWIHLTASSARGRRMVTLYTDMQPPLIAEPLDVSPAFVRIEGKQYVYVLELQSGQAVLLQPSNKVKLEPRVQPVAWPDWGGSNYWGKHLRTTFPPGTPITPTPPPAPPGPSPPLPPAPSPVPCGSVLSVPGYSCYIHRCAWDKMPPPHVGECGDDICNADVNRSVPVAKLCAAVPAVGVAAAKIAATKCSAFPGCNAFAECPVFTRTKCGHPQSTTCFKYFSTAKNNSHLVVHPSWTIWLAN